jgi:hypothetical protein
MQPSSGIRKKDLKECGVIKKAGSPARQKRSLTEKL